MYKKVVCETRKSARSHLAIMYRLTLFRAADLESPNMFSILKKHEWGGQQP